MRKAFLYKLSKDQKRAVFIDDGNFPEIQDFLSKKGNRKKFNYIVECILQDITNTEIYSREITEKIRNVTAMKAFKHGNNPRIYCQERIVDGKVSCVICCEYLLKKKTEGITGETLKVVEKVSAYKYDVGYMSKEINQEIQKRKDEEKEK